MRCRILVLGGGVAAETASRQLETAGFAVVRQPSLDGASDVSGIYDGAVISLEDTAEGLTQIRRLSARRREIAIVAIAELSAFAAASKAGASELVPASPLVEEALCSAVSRAVERHALANRIRNLGGLATLQARALVGESGGTVEARRMIAQIAGCDVNLAISGEPGTGKKLIAAQTHYASRRADEPLVVVDLASRAPEEHETTLLGDRNSPGALVAAERGTIVLVEPTALRPLLQRRLTEILSARLLPRRGASVSIDVRVVMTSRHRLANLVALGEFEEELFTCLAAIELATEPLRDRGYDIMQLAAHFAADKAAERGGTPPRIARAAATALMSYDWPGNVRELEHVIEQAVAEQPGEIALHHLPERVQDSEPKAPTQVPRSLPTLDEVERRYVAEVMSAVGGNKSRASRVLGIDRRTLYRLLRRLEWDGDDALSE